MSISGERVIELADVLAWHLFKVECDTSELKKSLEYYRATEDRVQFLQMLGVRSEKSGLFQRSRKTHEYYQEMNHKIREVLDPNKMESRDDLQVLGWAFRLLQYYDAEKPSHPVTQATAKAKQALADGTPQSDVSIKRRIGTVKWFDISKRYGFIRPKDGSEDVFVYISETPDEQGLQNGQRVSFKTKITPKGPRAQDVQPE